MSNEHPYVLSENVATMSRMAEFEPCSDFNEACIDWIRLGYNLNEEIDIDDLVSVADDYACVDWLIDNDFIERNLPKFKKGYTIQVACGKDLQPAFLPAYADLDQKGWENYTEGIKIKENAYKHLIFNFNEHNINSETDYVRIVHCTGKTITVISNL